MILQIDTQNKKDVLEGYNLLKAIIQLDSKSQEVHNETEMVVEKPKTKKTTKDTAKEEKALEVSQNDNTEVCENETKSSITLEVLKDSAKNALSRTDRVAVKTCISEFGKADKLADVSEDLYGKLYKQLQLLGK